jgi:DedD protein
MDSQLKQRLIGAAVLIALAIIFVPMLLTGEAPKTTSATVNLDIPPPPEREFETRVVPADGGQASVPAPNPSAAPRVNDDHVATVEADDNPRVEVPADAPVVTSGAKPPATAPTPASARPLVATTVPTPVASAPAANGNFVVHLGAYATRANADSLVAEAKKLGLPTLVEATEADGKPATRVRLGPYATRAAAEAARLKFKQSEPKLAASVVELAATSTADAPATAVPANRAGAWAVQLGAFKSQDEANKLRDRARNAGFTSFVDTSGQGDEKLWRVRVGPEIDRASSEKLRDQVKQKLTIAGMIVSVP